MLLAELNSFLPRFVHKKSSVGGLSSFTRVFNRSFGKAAATTAKEEEGYTKLKLATADTYTRTEGGSRYSAAKEKIKFLVLSQFAGITRQIEGDKGRERGGEISKVADSRQGEDINRRDEDTVKVKRNRFNLTL